jgi:hypothetical protein
MSIVTVPTDFELLETKPQGKHVSEAEHHVVSCGDV